MATVADRVDIMKRIATSSPEAIRRLVAHIEHKSKGARVDLESFDEDAWSALDGTLRETNDDVDWFAQSLAPVAEINASQFLFPDALRGCGLNDPERAVAEGRARQAAWLASLPSSALNDLVALSYLDSGTTASGSSDLSDRLKSLASAGEQVWPEDVVYERETNHYGVEKPPGLFALVDIPAGSVIGQCEGFVITAEDARKQRASNLITFEYGGRSHTVHRLVASNLRRPNLAALNRPSDVPFEAGEKVNANGREYTIVAVARDRCRVEDSRGTREVPTRQISAPDRPIFSSRAALRHFFQKVQCDDDPPDEERWRQVCMQFRHRVTNMKSHPVLRPNAIFAGDRAHDTEKYSYNSVIEHRRLKLVFYNRPLRNPAHWYPNVAWTVFPVPVEAYAEQSRHDVEAVLTLRLVDTNVVQMARPVAELARLVSHMMPLGSCEEGQWIPYDAAKLVDHPILKLKDGVYAGMIRECAVIDGDGSAVVLEMYVTPAVLAYLPLRVRACVLPDGAVLPFPLLHATERIDADVELLCDWKSAPEASIPETPPLVDATAHKIRADTRVCASSNRES